MRRSVAATIGVTALAGALGMGVWTARAVELGKGDPLCGAQPVCNVASGSGQMYLAPSAAQKLKARQITATPVAPATALTDKAEPGFGMGVDSGTVNVTLTDGLVAMRGGFELRDASGKGVSFSDAQSDLTAHKTGFLVKTEKDTAGTRVRALDFKISSVDALSKPGTLQMNGMTGKLTNEGAQAINTAFGGKALFSAGDEFIIGGASLGLATL